MAVLSFRMFPLQRSCGYFIHFILKVNFSVLFVFYVFHQIVFEVTDNFKAFKNSCSQGANSATVGFFLF